MVRLFNCQTFSLTRLLIFLLLLGNIGCQKEMSKDTLGAGGIVGGGGGNNTGGTAVFALVPSGSRCSDAAVTGLFEAGTILGADALLTVTVNVTKTGDWTYSTTASNGFSFVGAGNFTASGPQVITLMAVGKPSRGGIFNFNIKIGNGADCSVAVIVALAGGGGNGGNITGDFYYKLTFDGVNYSQDVTSTNNYIADPGVVGTSEAIFATGISYNSNSVPAGKTEIGIVKGILHGYTGTKAEFKAFFAPGNYQYGTIDIAGNTMTTDGVSITWIEPGGNDMWLTIDPSLQQGSTFKIVSATEVTDATGYYLKVKVQFSCKLYSVNSGGSVSKAVTNGEAVLKYVMQ